MAKKKLKVEVELETTKAKRQAKELEQSGSGAPGASVATSATRSNAADRAADKLARSLEKASKNASAFGDDVEATSSRMGRLAKSFAGIGAGMAMQYAAKFAPEGNARDAVNVVGGAVQGAAALSMLGGWGKLLGALGGGAKEVIDIVAAKKAAQADFKRHEATFEDARLWDSKIRNLTDVDPARVGATREEANADQQGKVDERIAQAKAEIERQLEKENQLIKNVNELLEDRKLEEAAAKTQELDLTRSRRQQLEGIERAFEKQKNALEREAEEIKLEAEKRKEKEAKKDKDPDFRASLSATDSLQKIGLTGADKVFGAVATEAAAGRGGAPRTGSFGFSVPTKAFSEMKFFQQPRPDWSEKATSEQLQRINGDQLKVLEKIEQKLGYMQGGSAWQ